MVIERKYLKLNDVSAYKTAFNLSNYVWNVVIKWDWFAKLQKLPKEINYQINLTNAKLTI
jgi:hypothetical protein